jgi:alpha-amylase
MKGVMNAVLDYPTWFELVPAFVSPEGDFNALKTVVQQTQSGYTSGAFMTGSFLENHDHPRFGSLTSDPAVRATPSPSPECQLKCRV